MKNQEIMTEIWKDIPGYEGLYQASTEGRIKSLDRVVDGISKWGTPRKIRRKGKIMKLSHPKTGYLRVALNKNGEEISYWVHRLVALTWIPNPDNLPQVNHKDEQKTNNFVFINPDGSVNPEKTNLEWCDASYNNSYGTKSQRTGVANTKRAKHILQIKNGVLIKEWDKSPRYIELETGFSSTCIYRCCKGVLKTAYGYIWKYKNGS